MFFAFPFLDGVIMHGNETTVHYLEILGIEFDAIVIKFFSCIPWVGISMFCMQE